MYAPIQLAGCIHKMIPAIAVRISKCLYQCVHLPCCWFGHVVCKKNMPLFIFIVPLHLLNLRKLIMTSSNGNIFRVTGPLCGEFTGPGEFPTQRPVTRSFDVFFDLRLNKRLGKHSWGWWFETLSWSLWRHHNGNWIKNKTSSIVWWTHCQYDCLIISLKYII